MKDTKGTNTMQSQNESAQALLWMQINDLMELINNSNLPKRDKVKAAIGVEVTKSTIERLSK